MPAARIGIPKTFTLINREWKVVWLTDAKLKALNAEWQSIGLQEDQKLWGFCDCEHATIYIKKGTNRDHMIHTFLHELMHALFFSLGWSQRFEDEEAMVDALGGCLHQWLKTKGGNLLD